MYHVSQKKSSQDLGVKLNYLNLERMTNPMGSRSLDYLIFDIFFIFWIFGVLGVF